MKRILVLALFCILPGCSGGGGGSDSGSSGGSSGTTDNSDSGSFAGTWEAKAGIATDGCHERISTVRQIFTVSDNTVDTGIISVGFVPSATGFTFGFEDTNGNCHRKYTGEFSNVTDLGATVSFSSVSNCGGQVCENTWTGTADRIDN